MAIVDLKNENANRWMKDIIKNNMINEAGAYGWMHDFGEYTPFDAYPANGDDPFHNHNDYPNQWAKVVEDAIAESNATHADQIVPFMRSGSSTSPKHTRLFWMGD